jgi:hypothetical protein
MCANTGAFCIKRPIILPEETITRHKVAVQVCFVGSTPFEPTYKLEQVGSSHAEPTIELFCWLHSV